VAQPGFPVARSYPLNSAPGGKNPDFDTVVPGAVARVATHAERRQQVATDRAQVGHQTKYALRDNGVLACTLTYGEPDTAMAIWKILMPGSHGTNDLYGAERFVKPDAPQLRTWLTPLVGEAHATELAQAVDAEPPPTAGWQEPDSDASGPGASAGS
jgi:hypothetical protein